jgi:exodeoxyribonuclease VII large subunit
VNARIWSVTELTRRIRDLFETEIDRVWVEGEISSWKVHPGSGHAYFCLKDERAVLTCVAWASTLRGVSRFLRPRDGMRVRLYGRITVYEQRGVYQLVVEQIFDQGEGALQAAFQKLKRKLEAEGLFDNARKRALPPFPRRIGIVTSSGGAALRDMLRILGRRWPLAEAILRPAAVQGTGAAADLAEAIGDLNEARAIDLIVIGRGGGSLEDLWAFNEEVLARAVHGSRVPVISAVGHEVDFTICDFAADARAATPTHAMELAAPDADEIARRLARDARFLRSELQRCLQSARLRLRRLGMSRGLRRPEDMLQDGKLTLDRSADRLRRALQARAEGERLLFSRLERRLLRAEPSGRIAQLRHRIELRRHAVGRGVPVRLESARRRLELAGARLAGLGPEQVLARGYGIITRASDGRVLRHADQTAAGEGVHVRLHAGRLECRVEETHPATRPLRSLTDLAEGEEPSRPKELPQEEVEGE